MYASTGTRPDLAYKVGVAGRSLKNVTEDAARAAKRTLLGACQSAAVGLHYGAVKDNILVGFVDADYGGDVASGKSTTGYVFMLNGGAVEWKSTLVLVISLFSLLAC